jgi:hypothetical protein
VAEGRKMPNKEKCAKLPDDVKEIFDMISAELCEAFDNIEVIERGTTNANAKRCAHHAAEAIRRAGEMCATCGIIAKQDWGGKNSNYGTAT